MKNFILKTLLLFVPLFSLKAEEEESEQLDDQLLVLFGASGYVIYKVLDFANDHGFRYIKILSYEFTGFEHQITGVFKGEQRGGGRFFELKDDTAVVAFLCFEEQPEDVYIIDLEKYRSLLETVQREQEED